jgi:glycosyltransferase involved in cell wall biosynthesis
MAPPTFSIVISTKNRKEALQFTLSSFYNLLNDNISCVVFDDGSTDGTSQMVLEKFPKTTLHRNEISKGYLYCRNFMLNATHAKYAISLDDDAHFLSDNPFISIENHFDQNPNCGVIAFRIFWSEEQPIAIATDDLVQRVKGFVGCGHVWRVEAWKKIPNYPEWFVFYGEEEFASYQLFKKKLEVHYLPSILVQHRVNVSARKAQTDYSQRLRRSLRSGWYLYFLFYPWTVIPKKMAYSIYIQLKNKTFKGDFKATFAMLQAIFDVLLNFPTVYKQSNRLSHDEYKSYQKLEESKLYWKPNEDPN